jgi:hypothetical protein
MPGYRNPSSRDSTVNPQNTMPACQGLREDCSNRLTVKWQSARRTKFQLASSHSRSPTNLSSRRGKQQDSPAHVSACINGRDWPQSCSSRRDGQHGSKASFFPAAGVRYPSNRLLHAAESRLTACSMPSTRPWTTISTPRIRSNLTPSRRAPNPMCFPSTPMPGYGTTCAAFNGCSIQARLSAACTGLLIPRSVFVQDDCLRPIGLDGLVHPSARPTKSVGPLRQDLLPSAAHPDRVQHSVRQGRPRSVLPVLLRHRLQLHAASLVRIPHQAARQVPQPPLGDQDAALPGAGVHVPVHGLLCDCRPGARPPSLAV